MTTEMTVAKMGRSMKNRENTSVPLTPVPSGLVNAHDDLHNQCACTGTHDRRPRHGTNTDLRQEEAEHQTQQCARRGGDDAPPAVGGEDGPVADALDDEEEHRRQED